MISTIELLPWLRYFTRKSDLSDLTSYVWFKFSLGLFFNFNIVGYGEFNPLLCFDIDLDLDFEEEGLLLHDVGLLIPLLDKS